MQMTNLRRAAGILAAGLIAVCLLLLAGYTVQKPAVSRQEFPFTITYEYQGQTHTITGVYIAEYEHTAKYIGDPALAWDGYIKDHNRLDWNYYRIIETEQESFAINLNLIPGYLMGDPGYAGAECIPSGEYHHLDLENPVTDPAGLEDLGFRIVSWEYPQPIENHFSFGGFSLSGETSLYTSAIALAMLLACMILIRKEPVYTLPDKVGIVLNYLVVFLAFPVIFLTAALSEILSHSSVWQQILYLSPALTILGVAMSVTLRRMGHRKTGFLSQFIGPAIFALVIMIEEL